MRKKAWNWAINVDVVYNRRYRYTWERERKLFRSLFRVSRDFFASRKVSRESEYSARRHDMHSTQHPRILSQTGVRGATFLFLFSLFEKFCNLLSEFSIFHYYIPRPRDSGDACAGELQTIDTMRWIWNWFYNIRIWLRAWTARVMMSSHKWRKLVPKKAIRTRWGTRALI